MKNIKIQKTYALDVPDERIEINGKILASEYHAPLTRFAIVNWGDKKEAIFVFSSTEPAL